MLRWKGRIWDGSSPGRLGGKTRCHPQPFGVQGWTDLFVHHLLALQNWPSAGSTQPWSHRKSNRQHEHSGACCISIVLPKSLCWIPLTPLNIGWNDLSVLGRSTWPLAYSPWHHSTVAQGPPGANCFPGPSWQQRTIPWFSSGSSLDWFKGNSNRKPPYLKVKNMVSG